MADVRERLIVSLAAGLLAMNFALVFAFILMFPWILLFGLLIAIGTFFIDWITERWRAG